MNKCMHDVHTHLCVYVCVCMHMCVCAYVYVFVCVCVRMFECLCGSVCVSMRVSLFIKGFYLLSLFTLFYLQQLTPMANALKLSVSFIILFFKL
jgi:hypothetical protein